MDTAKVDVRFNNFLKNAGFVLTSSTFIQILGLIQGIIMARALGPAKYGIYIGVIASVSFVNKLVDFRSFEATTRYLAAYLALGNREKAASTLSLCSIVDYLGGVIFFILVLLSRGFFYSNIVKSESAKEYIFLYALYLFILTTNSTISGTLRYFNKYNIVAIYNSLKSLFLFLGIVVILYLSSSPLDYIFRLYVGLALVFFIIKYGIWLYFLKSYNLLKLNNLLFWNHLERSEVYNIMKFLLHTNISYSLSLSVKFIDVLIIGYILTPTAVGIYKVGKSTASLLRRIVDPMYVAIYPELSDLFAKNNKDEFKALIKKTFKITLYILIPFSVIYFLFTKQIIVLLVSGKYLSSVLLARIMGIGIFVDSLYFWLYPAILSMGKSGEYVKITLITTIIFLVFAFSTTYVIGLPGMALSYSLFFLIKIALSYYIFKNFLNSEWYNNE